jgi:hypothetical protein
MWLGAPAGFAGLRFAIQRMVRQTLVCRQRRGGVSYSSPSQLCASSTVEKILMSAPL